MAFVEGQKVKCVNNICKYGPQNPLPCLTVDRVYVVIDTPNGSVKFKDDANRERILDKDRFVAYVENAPVQAIIEEIPEAAPGVKIVCVVGLREAGLRVGKVCTIRHVKATLYYTEEFPGLGFARRRFNIQPVMKAVEKERELVQGDIVYITSAPKSSYEGWDKSCVNDGREYEIKELVCQIAIPHHEDLSLITSNDKGYGGFYVPRAALSLKKAAPPRMFKVGDKVKVIKAPPENKMMDGVNWTREMRTNVEVGKVLTIWHLPGHRGGKYENCIQMKEDQYFYNKECVVFADTGLPEGSVAGAAITAKAPPPKPKVKSLEDHLVDMRSIAVGSTGICSYAVKPVGIDKVDEFMSPACYASAHYYPQGMEAFVFSLNNPYKRVAEEKHPLIKQWQEYVLYRSPWSDVFIKQDYETNIKNGVQCDVSKTLSQIVGGAIAIRVAGEYPARLDSFAHFIEQGYGENTAFLMAHIVAYADGKFTQINIGGNHDVLSSQHNFKDLIKFFQQGYHVDLKEKPAKESANSYKIFKAVANESGDTLRNEVEKTLTCMKEGKGWEAMEYIVPDSVYNFAEQLNKLIN